MSNLFQFFNDLGVKQNTESTIRNIDNLGIKMLNMNQRIDPRLLNEYKLLDTYRLQLLQNLSLIDSIMNKKNKCQNTINDLLNTILRSRNSEQFGGMRNILIDHMFNSMKYRQYGGADANTIPEEFLKEKNLKNFLDDYEKKKLDDYYNNNLKKKLNNHKDKLNLLKINIESIVNSLNTLFFPKISLINSTDKQIDDLKKNVTAYQTKLQEIITNFKNFIETKSDINITDFESIISAIELKLKNLEMEIKKIDPTFSIKGEDKPST